VHGMTLSFLRSFRMRYSSTLMVERFWHQNSDVFLQDQITAINIRTRFKRVIKILLIGTWLLNGGWASLTQKLKNNVTTKFEGHVFVFNESICKILDIR
jgi:hypothetical protein